MQLSSIQPASATPRARPEVTSDVDVHGHRAASEVEVSPEEERAAAQQAKQDGTQRALDAQEVQRLRARDAEAREHEQAQEAADGDSAARSGVDGREREASTSSSRQQRAAAAYASPGARPGATVDRRY